MRHSATVGAAANDVIEAYASALIGTGRARIELPELISAWDEADPAWAGSTEGRLRLVDALERLDVGAVIELPSRNGRCWEMALPRLPTRVAVPANRRPALRALDPANEPWLPALDWVGGWMRAAKPPQRLRLAVQSVNRWLASTVGRNPPTISREERSLEVFGDEKLLASLTGTALFEPGRLTLATLACEPPVGGLRVARLAPAGPVLVMENKAAFDSAWRALRADAASGLAPGYAAVIFGGGDHSASLLYDLKTLDALVGVTPSRIDYAGDVDVAGISAAAAFLDTARREGLPAEPSATLWRALAILKPTGEDLTGDDDERRAALDAVARLGLPSEVAMRLREGVRVPQERHTRVAFADTAWWTQ